MRGFRSVSYSPLGKCQSSLHSCRVEVPALRVCNRGLVLCPSNFLDSCFMIPTPQPLHRDISPGNVFSSLTSLSNEELDLC